MIINDLRILTPTDTERTSAGITYGSLCAIANNADAGHDIWMDGFSYSAEEFRTAAKLLNHFRCAKEIKIWRDNDDKGEKS